MFPAKYTIDGQYVKTIVDDVDVAVGGSATDYKEVDYLFDATAETALAASDFVLVSYRRESTTIGAGSSMAVAFDTQGDSGSGALATSGNTTAQNCVWVSCDGNVLALPSSLFLGSQSTRTGRIRVIEIAGTVAIPVNHTVLFTFCSITTDSSNAFDPGEFTVDGGVIITTNATANTNSTYDFDATGDGYVTAADFAIVQTTFLGGSSGAANVPYVRFTGSGGSGSTTIVTTTGTSAPAEATFVVTPISPIVLPAVFFTTGGARVGVTKSGSVSQEVIFNFCSWSL